MKFIFVSACGKIEKLNIVYMLSLELLNVAGHDFSHPCDGPQDIHLLLIRPLVGTEFDIPVVEFILMIL
jgi:hypothetical protein